MREAKSEEEKAFLLSELALELARAKPEFQPGCLAPELHQAEIRQVISDLRELVPELSLEGPENRRKYVQSVFDAVLT